MYVNSMLIVMGKSLPAKGFLVYKCKKKSSNLLRGHLECKITYSTKQNKRQIKHLFYLPSIKPLDNY